MSNQKRLIEHVPFFQAHLAGLDQEVILEVKSGKVVLWSLRVHGSANLIMDAINNTTQDAYNQGFQDGKEAAGGEGADRV